MSEALTVYTIDATYVTPEHYLARPYERIVGVKAEENQTLWASQRHTLPVEGRYTRTDVEERHLALTPELNDRFIKFFKRFMVNGIPAGDDYNCHRFAKWMTGDNAQKEGLNYKDAVDFMKIGTLSDRRLKLGELGIFGAVAGGLPVHLHSVIGLGQKSSDCLQVFSAQGHVGITSYDNVKDFFGRSVSLLIEDYGLYATQQDA